VGGDNLSNLTSKKKPYEISQTEMIFKDTIIYNALGFQYTGNLNNKRYINLSLTAYIKRRFKQLDCQQFHRHQQKEQLDITITY
jgi:hypothetical protein